MHREKLYDDYCEQQSILALLKGVMAKLMNIRRGERNRKKRWKIKNAMMTSPVTPVSNLLQLRIAVLFCNYQFELIFSHR